LQRELFPNVDLCYVKDWVVCVHLPKLKRRLRFALPKTQGGWLGTPEQQFRFFVKSD
jgi:hypothetical protein